MKFLCWFGIHKWEPFYTVPDGGMDRCWRCYARRYYGKEAL